MPSIRILCMVLLSFLLAACGGGGSLDTSGGGGGSGSSTYKLEVILTSGDGGEGIATISKDVPGQLEATLTKDGKVFVNQLVSFTLDQFNGTTVGVLDPEVGTSQTNSAGVAKMTLRAGTVAGSGTVTASFQDPDGEAVSVSLVFTSLGDEDGTGGEQGTLKMTLSVVDKNGQPFTDANPITKDNPGTVTATITEDDQPLAQGLVSFATAFTGKILSDTSTQLISNGTASIELGAGDFKGAGKVTASLDGSELLSQAFFFSSGDGASVETAEATLDVKLLIDCNDGWDANRDSAKLDPTDPTTGCTVVNRDISSDKLGTIFVSANNANTGDGFPGILVDVNTSLGRLLPDSGNAVTDNFGIALLTLQPGTANDSGIITATAKNVSATKAFNVGVAEISLQIDNGLPVIDNVTQPLAAGATTVITVSIFDTDGVSLLPLPLDVELSSGCTAAGKAELDAKVTSISGIATATYRSTGCFTAEGDTVTATVNGKTIQTNIPLSSAEVAAIEFMGSTQPVIALKGTGGAQRTESSEITFRLKDELGIPSSQGRIDFKLSSYNGGISLNPMSVKTNTEGLAKTTVTAGTIPTAMRVHACFIPEDKIPTNEADDVTCWKEIYDACQADPSGENCPTGNLSLLALDEQIISVSDMLTVTSGLPDNDSFTLGVDILNPEALLYNGEISQVTVYMADHFNNPVPDGTSVYLRTEGGTIGTLDGGQFTPLQQCETIDGECNLQWRSQNPKPFTDARWGSQINSINPKTGVINCDPFFGAAAPCQFGINNAAFDVDNGVPLAGRATILATAKGEEVYIDRNANGVFDVGEYYSAFDLPEAFIDNNENNVFEGDVDCSTGENCLPTNTNAGEFEEYVDLNLDQEYTFADGKFNGLVCSEAAEAAGRCNKELIDVRQSTEIIMSGSFAHGRVMIRRNSLAGHPALVFGGYPTDALPANCESIVLSEPENGDWEFTGNFFSVQLLELELSEFADYCDIRTVDLSFIFIHTNDDDDVNTPSNCDREPGLYDADERRCTDTEDSPREIGIGGIDFTMLFSDINNNALPSGTTIRGIVTNGDSGAQDISDTLTNSTQVGASAYGLTVTREGTPNKVIGGHVQLEFVTPKGNTSRLTLNVKDDG